MHRPSRILASKACSVLVFMVIWRIEGRSRTSHSTGPLSDLLDLMVCGVVPSNLPSMRAPPAVSLAVPLEAVAV